MAGLTATSARQLKAFGVTQIVLGFFCMAAAAGYAIVNLFAHQVKYGPDFYYINYSTIVCFALSSWFTLAGSVSVAASRRHSRCLLILTVIFAGLAVACSIVVALYAGGILHNLKAENGDIMRTKPSPPRHPGRAMPAYHHPTQTWMSSTRPDLENFFVDDKAPSMPRVSSVWDWLQKSLFLDSTTDGPPPTTTTTPRPSTTPALSLALAYQQNLRKWQQEKILYIAKLPLVAAIIAFAVVEIPFTLMSLVVVSRNLNSCRCCCCCGVKNGESEDEEDNEPIPVFVGVAHDKKPLLDAMETPSVRIAGKK